EGRPQPSPLPHPGTGGGRGGGKGVPAVRPIVQLTFAVCAAMTVVLCGYLYWVSSLLRRISDNLGDVNDMVGDVIGHATTIVPDLQHANRTLGSISGALPLLYGLAEKTVAKKQGGHALSARRSNRVGAGQAGFATVANLVTVAIVAVEIGRASCRERVETAVGARCRRL